MYKDLGMNDTVNDNYEFDFQSPKYADYMSSNMPSKHAVGMCKFYKQRAPNAFVNLDLFYSYHD